jgi:hypothetical protein
MKDMRRETVESRSPRRDVSSLKSDVLCLLNSDYCHYLAWIAKPFNNNALQHFHQEKMITSITYSLANDYYIHYLQRNRKIRKLRTEAEN